MATEPETLIPLVRFSWTKKVMFMGSSAPAWVPGGSLCWGANWLKMAKMLGCLWR